MGDACFCSGVGETARIARTEEEIPVKNVTIMVMTLRRILYTGVVCASEPQ